MKLLFAMLAAAGLSGCVGYVPYYGGAYPAYGATQVDPAYGTYGSYPAYPYSYSYPYAYSSPYAYPYYGPSISFGAFFGGGYGHRHYRNWGGRGRDWDHRR